MLCIVKNYYEKFASVEVENTRILEGDLPYLIVTEENERPVSIWLTVPSLKDVDEILAIVPKKAKKVVKETAPTEQKIIGRPVLFLNENLAEYITDTYSYVTARGFPVPKDSYVLGVFQCGRFYASDSILPVHLLQILDQLDMAAYLIFQRKDL
ncbi:MAG: hypothetical protein N3A54_02270 [Patescibacteria group bacterium]|nr:hypothetical protein [Patescibacteria group bacterium]